MTTLDLPVIFSLVAHELRSPASVIAGCARMLNEGRLSEEDRLRVYGQIERAALRVTAICQQSSDTARWLRPAPAPLPTSPLSLRALLTSALAQSPAGARVDANKILGTDIETLCIPALDRSALISAVSTMVDLVCRETPDGAIGLAVRPDPEAMSCDILIGPFDVLAGLAAASREAATTNQLSLEAGGMGLALVVCVAIIAAHDGHILTFPEHRNVVGARLRAQRES